MDRIFIMDLLDCADIRDRSALCRGCAICAESVLTDCCAAFGAQPMHGQRGGEQP
jgi:hypothetical protein